MNTAGGSQETLMEDEFEDLKRVQPKNGKGEVWKEAEEDRHFRPSKGLLTYC